MSEQSSHIARALHLHSLESLCADLMRGLPILCGRQGAEFVLDGDDARRLLSWYWNRAGRWGANVAQGDVDAIAAAVGEATIPATATVLKAPADPTRRLRLARVEAYRFAGLHVAVAGNGQPEPFVFEPICSLTLLEGLNGSGKTSLVNAIVWALTGQVLRPQRKPEPGSLEFLCTIEQSASSEAPSEHRLSPVTPLPADMEARPARDWVDTDTWVQLEFVDNTGCPLPAVRRTQSRTSRGKLEEAVTNLDVLDLDPACLRVGTVMPGLLPFIQVGAASELGKAIAELTGLGDLVVLSGHARRAKQHMDGPATKARERELEAADTAYTRVREGLARTDGADLTAVLHLPIPLPSEGLGVETRLAEISLELARRKADALAGGREILGAGFDPGLPASREDLLANVKPAMAELRGMGKLPAATRLSALGKVPLGDLTSARARIASIIEESAALAELEGEKASAARVRLYSRIAAWHADHLDGSALDTACVVCGSELDDLIDPVTGKPIGKHLAEAAAGGSALLSQTVRQWADATRGELARDLPAALSASLGQDLPGHPGDLVKAAIGEELFETSPFAGVLGALKALVVKNARAAIDGWPLLEEAGDTALRVEAPATGPLQIALRRLDRAIRFAEWRLRNQSHVAAFWNDVVGTGENPGAATLLGKLLALQAIVDAAGPVNAASKAVDTLAADLSKRRQAEAKIASYKRASAALAELFCLGSLAQEQIDALQSQLQARASEWRSRIYSGAFPSASHALVGTAMTGTGQIDLQVGAQGVAAPAQHVANASSLRASLVGFFLAYWEHLMHERGGLQLLVLDDPQDLLDEENRERFAGSLQALLESDAQLVVTTHDRSFAGSVSALQRKGVTVDHRSIHPATKHRPVVRLPASVIGIVAYEQRHRADPDDVYSAQDYASECRLFVEARLGDIFDDAAYPAWAAPHHAPSLADHLAKLRSLAKKPPSELFRSAAIQDFCADPGLADGSPELALLNKAHHAKRDIRPSEVAALFQALVRIRKGAEKAHEECRRWRRRDRATAVARAVASLPAITSAPNFRVMIHADLAALTNGSPQGPSDDVLVGSISGSWLAGKALCYMRSDNLGFQLPRRAIAVAEAEPGPGRDRDLVIAAHGGVLLARRLLRTRAGTAIALAAETPDPRHRPPTLVVPEEEVAIHRIVGVLFDERAIPPKATGDVAILAESRMLERVEVAFQVRGESAVPLALPGQVVLGGQAVELASIGTLAGSLVAVLLDDGSELFKRVAGALPRPLAHVRQFESIGGLGDSQLFAIGKPQDGFRQVVEARPILAVVYEGA